MSVELLLTILASSLLGSTHCAGMCGPFVVLLVGRGNPAQPGPVGMSVTGRLLAYHLGRLTTYLLFGMLAGLLGMTLNKTGALLGWQQGAAILAGVTMLLTALVLLLRQWGVQLQHLPVPMPWVKTIYAGFRRAQNWPSLMRAWWVGLLTTWIPCGWLYAFVLVAAGTGDVLSGGFMMLAFWLGTVPILSLVGYSSVQVSTRWRAASPWIAIAACVTLSWFMLFHRSFISFDMMNQQLTGLPVTTDSVQRLNQVKLPCCHDD